MTYAGNPEVAPEARKRVEATFQNSIRAVSEGKDQEALLGCEFVLRMDPDYTPAKTLVARIESGQRPVATDDLLGQGAAASAPGANATSSGLGTVLQDLLSRRNYQQVLQIAQSQSAAIQKDPELGKLVQQAQEKLESEQFVVKFLDSARAAREKGDHATAEGLLQKARSLDPSHPGIAELTGGATEVMPEIEPVFAEAIEEEEDPGDLMDLQQQSLGLGGEDEEEDFLSMDEGGDDDDLAGLDDDLEALDLGDDLEDLGDFEDLEDLEPAVVEPAVVEPAAAAVPSDSLDLGGGDGGLDELGGDDFLDFDAPAGELDDLGAEAFDSAEPAESSAFAEAPTDLGTDEDELELVDGFATDGPAVSPPPDPAEGDASDGQRIQRLLDEGKVAFDREEYQVAIDSWSRIFLIDIDNGEASRLIEEARKKKAEVDRQAEELFHEAGDQIENQQLEEAKATLARVLELQPEHSIARDYLDQLEEGKVPTVARRSSFDEDGGSDEDGFEGLDVTEGPAQSMDAAVQRDRIVVVKKTDKKMVAVAAAGAVVILGGAGFLFTQWDNLFPNAEAPPTAPAPRVDPIERATQMQEEGRTENAIAILRKVQPSDPSYAEAQTLIGQWEELIASESQPTGPSEEVLARREVLLRAAREAFTENRNITAQKYFERAHRVFPLDAEDLSRKREAENRLLPLEMELENFEIGEYTTILPSLWRMLESDPQNRDVRSLIVDSYFNLGLRDLQRGDPRSAIEKLEEASELAPEDVDLERLRLFAKTYNERSPDLIYRIFVKYLPTRS